MLDGLPKHGLRGNVPTCKSYKAINTKHTPLHSKTFQLI